MKVWGGRDNHAPTADDQANLNTIDAKAIYTPLLGAARGTAKWRERQPTRHDTGPSELGAVMKETSASREGARMLAENVRREKELPADFYSLTKPANLFTRHGQERALLWALQQAGSLPLAGKRVLEVGCGTGQWFCAFENFGARQNDLAGIEIDASRLTQAKERYPHADLHLGDATSLPWPDASFQLVWQSTVFTSILDDDTRTTLAREMVRVLAPGGAIVWYDFSYDNPRNPHVRGVGRNSIRALFPACRVTTRRVTLAPPLARRLVPHCRWLAVLLENALFLNTHLIGVIQPWTESASLISR